MRAGSRNLTFTELVGPTVTLCRPWQPAARRRSCSAAAARAHAGAGHRGRHHRRRRDERRASTRRATASTSGEPRRHAGRRSNDAGRRRPDERLRRDPGRRRRRRERQACAPRAVGIVIRAERLQPRAVDPRRRPRQRHPAVERRRPVPWPVVGVIDYSFGNFKLDGHHAAGRRRRPARARGHDGRRRRRRSWRWPPSTSRTSRPSDPQAKFDALAEPDRRPTSQSPDVVVARRDPGQQRRDQRRRRRRRPDADQLIAAIAGRRRPAYQWRQIDPVDDQDGGAARRQHPRRASSSAPTAASPSSTGPAARLDHRPTSSTSAAGRPQLHVQPRRIDPAEPRLRRPAASRWWASSPFGGHTLFVVANHFNSKGGDDPLFGRFQPPVRSSEVQRMPQAQVVNDFVQVDLRPSTRRRTSWCSATSTTSSSPSAIAILKGGSCLVNLMDSLPRGRALHLRVRRQRAVARPHARQPGTCRPGEPGARHRAHQRGVQSAGQRPRSGGAVHWRWCPPASSTPTTMSTAMTSR